MLAEKGLGFQVLSWVQELVVQVGAVLLDGMLMQLVTKVNENEILIFDLPFRIKKKMKSLLFLFFGKENMLVSF